MPLIKIIRQTMQLLLVGTLALIITITTALDACPQERTKKRVLLLNSYNLGYTWTDYLIKGIEEVFKSSDQTIETYVSFMDLKRIPYSEQYILHFKEWLHESYKNIQFDAILAIDNDALEFLRKYRDELYPEVPVVFTGINNFDNQMLDGRHDLTGLSEDPDYPSTIRLALKLRPQINKIIVITDNTTTGRAHLSAVKKIEPTFSGRISFQYLSAGDYTFDELAHNLETLHNDSIVLLLQHFMDKNETTQTVQEGTAFLTSRCTVPCFTVNEIRVGLGALGGNVVSGYHYGQAAADMILKILHGTAIKDIPVRIGPNQNMFDYNVMRRFQVSERDLPAGSIIRNQPASLYSQHKNAIITTGIVMLALLCLVIGMSFDIKRRRDVEKSLRESEERFRVLVEQAPEAIAVYDTDLNRFVDANANAEKLFGCDRKEFMRLGPLPFFPEKQPDGLPVALSMQKHIEQALTGEKVMFQRAIHNANGQDLLCEVWLVRLPSADRRLLRASYIDITDRKRAEEEKERLESQLRQAQKLEAIGVLAGGIAHDFNNILFAINGYTELALEKNANKNPVLANDLNKILQSGHRARDLVKQILDFSRKDVLDKKPIQISLLVKEGLKFLRASIPSNIEFKTSISQESAKSQILADPTQLHQILMNLCANAAYAMRDKGGVIWVDLSNVESDYGSSFTPSAPGLAPGQYVKLSVSDTGHGMTPEVKERIFEPYFTTKPTGEGTGLGLATIYGIVNACEGAITVDSEPGDGTKFQIFFPRIIEMPSVASETDSPLITSVQGRILLVDDEEYLVDVVTTILQTLGCTVKATNSSLEALAVFQKEPDSFDLIVTDQTMPRMTGTELATQILKIRPDIPIILCTGYSQTVNAEQAKALGIGRFLSKPISKRELAQAVGEMLGR